MVPSRVYGRRAVALRHPTRISRGVPTTVHGVLPVEINALRPDRFQFAVTELDDWAVSDFRVHGVSQVRAVRDANGDDLPCRIGAFLSRELACTGEHECVRLELVEATGLRDGKLINAWNREHIARWRQEDLAVEILRHARNFTETLGVERSRGSGLGDRVCRFEARAQQRLGNRNRMSFWILADLKNSPSWPPRFHPRGLVNSLIEGGCAIIQAQMTFEMDVVYLGPRADEEFCCFLSGPHVPSERGARLALRGGRCVPLPMPSYTSVERLAQATISTPVDRPIELVDLVVRDAADWVIGDISVDGVAWLPWNVGTAEQLADCLRCGLRCDPLYKSRVIPQGSVVSMSVLYVGPQESAVFWGCLVGRAPLGEDDASTRGDWDMELSSSTGDVRIQPRVGSALVTEYLSGPPVCVKSVTVVSPQDWIIEDVLLDGRSVLARAGSFVSETLGEMGQLGMHLGVARERIEFLVSYVGKDEAGAAFQCAIRGSSEALPLRLGSASTQESDIRAGWDPYPE